MRVWVGLTSAGEALSAMRHSKQRGLRIRRDPRELVTLLLSATDV
jgi:hypothetical protein